MSITPTTTSIRGRRARVAALMGAEAATLAAISVLHLSSVLGGGTRPFSELGAGLGEAVICVVLAYGALRLLRGARRARLVAIASTIFAIVGFAIGLSITLSGGGLIDVAYHVTMIPVLLCTLRALRRLPRAPRTSGWDRGQGRQPAMPAASTQPGI